MIKNKPDSAARAPQLPRRDLLGKGVLGAIGLGVAACAGKEQTSAAIVTQPRVQWRLASSFPRSLDTIYGAAEVLADRVEKLSEGRFSIRAYPSGELVPPLQVLDAVQQGTVHAGHTASYYFTGKNPALAFDTAVPFGMTSRQQSAWLYQQGGLELIHEVLADFNILSFPGGNTGTQMGGWFRREVSTRADLKGLKMRIPGLGAEVLSELGTTVQTIPGGEIYPALERGAIDATEWVGPYDDEKLGFHKVAKYYYYPGWWEPGPNLSVYVNRDAWNKLPSLYQEIFTTATYQTHVTMQARYDALNPEALIRLLAYGVEMRKFSDEILDAAFAQSTALLDQLAGRDALYRKIYDHWRRARTDSHRWFETAELSYCQYAFPRHG